MVVVRLQGLEAADEVQVDPTEDILEENHLRREQRVSQRVVLTQPVTDEGIEGIEAVDEIRPLRVILAGRRTPLAEVGIG